MKRILLLLLINILTIPNIGLSQDYFGVKDGEVPPAYPNGLDAFRNYVAQNMRYSLISDIKGKSSGVVKVKFVIDTLGNVTKAKVLKSHNKYARQEALRVVNNSKRWEPGSIHGVKKNVKFSLPIRMVDKQPNLKNASVILNGGIIKTNKLIDKLDSPYPPHIVFDYEFKNALFGENDRAALVFIQELSKTNRTTKKEISTTLAKLKNIDTTKFLLYLNTSIQPWDKWSKYLNNDSITNIYISNQYKNGKTLGEVYLLTAEGEKNWKTKIYKEFAEKQAFLDLVKNYREGKRELPNKLMYVDDSPYYTKWLLDSLNLSIIERVVRTEPDSIIGKFNDERKLGYYQLFTRDFRPNQVEEFKQNLDKILHDYANNSVEDKDYAVFINSQPENLQTLSLLDKNSIIWLHIINVEKAKNLFGSLENKSIIYIHRR